MSALSISTIPAFEDITTTLGRLLDVLCFCLVDIILNAYKLTLKLSL